MRKLFKPTLLLFLCLVAALLVVTGGDTQTTHATSNVPYEPGSCSGDVQNTGISYDANTYTTVQNASELHMGVFSFAGSSAPAIGGETCDVRLVLYVSAVVIEDGWYNVRTTVNGVTT